MKMWNVKSETLADKVREWGTEMGEFTVHDIVDAHCDWNITSREVVHALTAMGWPRERRDGVTVWRCPS